MLEQFWIYWYENQSYVLLIIFLMFIFGIVKNIPIGETKKEEKDKKRKIINTFNLSILALGLLSILLWSIIELINPKKIHYEVGLDFYEGRNNYTPDKDRAQKAFERAAKAGNVEACKKLAEIHKSKKDIFETIKWYKRGIALGDSQCAIYLAQLYDKEKFISLTEKEKIESAYMAYVMAACLGDKTAKIKIDQLHKQISWEIDEEVNEMCSELKKQLRR